MPTDITIVPGTKSGKSTDTKSKDSRTANPKKTQIIMEFLHECTPYEADALRAMLSIAAGKSTVETMPQYDRAISTSDATRKPPEPTVYGRIDRPGHWS